MKIGFVLDDTLDTPDGVQQYVLNVGGWLSEQGHEVHYLVGKTARQDIENLHPLSRNLRVRFNGNRMSMPLPTSRKKIREFLLDQKFDVIHVQVPYSPFMAGRLLHEVPLRTAVVGTFHILPYSRMVRSANRALGAWNKRSGNRFDQMLAVSEPAKAFAEQTYGYRNVVVVPNPVRIAQFEQKVSTDETLNIVFLGRLVERKGALQLLKAVAYVREAQLYEGEFKVRIGGKGELLNKLQAFVVTHGLEDIVIFDGFITEEAKPSFLASADIAVFPSSGGESFGIVLLEAMAASRGVVLAGDNPGYASVMQPFPEQLFDTQNIRAFANLLAQWLDNVVERTHQAKKQQEYVVQFDINEVGRRLVDVYDDTLQVKAKS